MIQDVKIAVIGPGVMGKAIVACLINKAHVDPNHIKVGGPNADRLRVLSETYQVSIYQDNGQAVQDADVVVLAVKPQRFLQTAQSIKSFLQKDALVISIIAGVPTILLMEKLGTPYIVRTMPNTCSQIGVGMTVWMKTTQVDDRKKALAAEVIKTLGDEIFVEDESYLDMATALSANGPAYVFLFMEAMIDAGVHMGFPRRIAEQLVVQTLRGSTDFYAANHEHPAQMRNDVTSPGGTSAESLYYLEKAGFRTAISRAIWAGYQRSKELGEGRLKGKLEE